jgi:hypothetical protein
MALDPFSSVFTAKQIVTLAERRVNNPGLHLTPSGLEPGGGTGDYATYPMVDAPGYAELQMILDELALVKNFTFTRTAVDFNITARINDLPTLNNGSSVGYWRIGFSDPAWLVSTTSNVNDRSRITFLDAEQFHSRFEDGITGRPEIAYINRSNGTIIVDPAPDGPYIMEVHCYPWQAALATIDSRPWFPNSAYLVEALVEKLAFHQDDMRRQEAAQNKMMMMKRLVSSLGDERDHASTKIELDPTYYSTPMEL